MSQSPHSSPVLASQIDGSSTEGPILELPRDGLKQVIMFNFAAALEADRHERRKEWLGYRNGYRPPNPHYTDGPHLSADALNADRQLHNLETRASSTGRPSPPKP